MKLQLIRSSSVIVESNGVRILMDPWLVDGEYYGSWNHSPAVDYSLDQFNDVDYIYISHIHPDHMSKKTLGALDRKIPVIIHGYDAKFLKLNIENLGYKTIELPHNLRTPLKNGVHINILAADNCDPELCGKFFGCVALSRSGGTTQIDSLAVIDDGEYTLVNVNDCPYELAKASCAKVLEQYGEPDILLTGYSGAGPYPQCFANLSDAEKLQKAAAKKKTFLHQAEQFIAALKPTHFLPFAGTYLLGGRLAALNEFRGVPAIEEAYDYFEASESVRASGSRCLRLNPLEIFDCPSNSVVNARTPVSLESQNRYLHDELPKRPLEYEQDEEPSLDSLISLATAAHDRLMKRATNSKFRSETLIFVHLKDSKAARISFAGLPLAIVDENEIPKAENYVSLKIDSRLLKRILSGPKYAHWNNAEIGSHIEYFRSPDRYERGIYEMMNYFHA